MSRCNFCKREFPNPQAVRAHLRWCPQYSKSEKGTSRRISRFDSRLSSSKSPHQDGLAPIGSSNPFAILVDQITHQFAGPDEATRRKQKRETLLAGLCSSLVDCYHPLEGGITPDMAVAAKVAILDELGAMAIEDMPQAELTLRGTAIRNRSLAPYLQRQHKQRERQQAQLKRDTRRRQRETAAQSRQLTRKAALIELGVARALQSASSRGLTGRALTLLEWEVRTRLETLLIGDETEQQVEETIEAAIERPLLDWAVRIEQAESAKRERMLDQCLALALPVAEATWPWVKDVVIKKLCERFGVQPTTATTEATTSEPSSAPQTADAPPRHIRRRRQQSVSPDVTPTETVAQETSDASVPTVNRAATR